VLHVGHSDEQYHAGHIPGALFLPLSAVATTVGGVANEFPAPEQLAATFRDLGVGNSARIVIYGDDPGLLAARVWAALDLLGHSAQAAILDGGLTRWTAERRTVETTVRARHPEPFASRWRSMGSYRRHGSALTWATALSCSWMPGRGNSTQVPRRMPAAAIYLARRACIG